MVDPVWANSLCPLDLMSVSFPRLGKFSVIISSDMFSAPFSVSSHCGFPVMLVRLILSQGSLRLSSVLFILFTLFCSSAVISTILSSSSLIHSSASDILLLIPSRVFLISVIVLFVCLFFNSSSAAAKSLQSCPTLCDPMDGQPTRLPRPWDSPGKNTGVGCHFLLQCMKVKSESEVAQSCLTLSDPMDCSLPGSSVH